jgi:1-acyl-sn-glycerol-3-phosphate acyltransferase
MAAVDDGVLRPPNWREVLRWPLPHKGLGDRLLIRLVTLIIKQQVVSIRGLEHVAPDRDPFILIANHGSRRDVIVMPTMLMLYRGGRPIHFFVDWNFMLIPGVAKIYRCGGTITVSRKPAKPPILNALRPLFVDTVAPNDRARRHLAAGRSIGVFPEGAANRDRNRLLPGRNGAARLSLETGVPVVPIGLRFSGRDTDSSAAGPMEIVIGPPRHPPAIEAKQAPLAAVRDWHATLMSDIAQLSGMRWGSPQGDGEQS